MLRKYLQTVGFGAVCTILVLVPAVFARHYYPSTRYGPDPRPCSTPATAEFIARVPGYDEDEDSYWIKCFGELPIVLYLSPVASK